MNLSNTRNNQDQEKLKNVKVFFCFGEEKKIVDLLLESECVVLLFFSDDN